MRKTRLLKSRQRFRVLRPRSSRWSSNSKPKLPRRPPRVTQRHWPPPGAQRPLSVWSTPEASVASRCSRSRRRKLRSGSPTCTAAPDPTAGTARASLNGRLRRQVCSFRAPPPTSTQPFRTRLRSARSHLATCFSGRLTSQIPTTIHHVAIYVGNGLMLAAPHTGTNVQVQPVYLDGYIGAVRIG